MIRRERKMALRSSLHDSIVKMGKAVFDAQQPLLRALEGRVKVVSQEIDREEKRFSIGYTISRPRRCMLELNKSSWDRGDGHERRTSSVSIASSMSGCEGMAMNQQKSSGDSSLL